MTYPVPYPRIYEVLSQPDLPAIYERLRDAARPVTELRDHMFYWVAIYGEPCHVKLLQRQYLITNLLDRRRFDLSYMAKFPLTEQRRAVHRLLGRSFWPSISDIVRASLSMESRNNWILYEWAQFTIMENPCWKLRNHELSLRAILHLALIEDTRIVGLFEKLFAAGRVSARDYATALELLGALRVLRNDVPNGIRIWFRCIDLRRLGISTVGQNDLDEDGRSVKVKTDTLEHILTPHPRPHKMLVQAVGIFRRTMEKLDRCMYIYRNCETPHNYHFEIMEDALKTAVRLAKSTKHCFKMLTAVIDYVEDFPKGHESNGQGFRVLYTHTVFTPLLHRMVDYADFDGFRGHFVLQDIIKVFVALNFGTFPVRCAKHCERCEKLTAALCTKINLNELSQTRIRLEKLGRLLYGVLHLAIRDTSDKAVYGNLIRVLLGKGAFCNVKGKYKIDSYQLILSGICENKEIAFSKQVVISQCSCQHPESHREAIPLLRCLSAKVLNSSRTKRRPPVCVIDGFVLAPLPTNIALSKCVMQEDRDPQMWLANGLARVPLAHFIKMHASFMSKASVSPYDWMYD